METEKFTINEMDEITYEIVSNKQIFTILNNNFEGTNILEQLWKSSVILKWEINKLNDIAAVVNSEAFLDFVKKRWNIKNNEEITFNFFAKQEDNWTWYMYINTPYQHIYSAYMPTLTELIVLFQENEWEINEPEDSWYLANITNDLYRQYKYLQSDKSSMINDFHLPDTKFLSNFDYVSCSFTYNWIPYTCVENAYQAAKFDETSIKKMKQDEAFIKKYGHISNLGDLVKYISSLPASDAKKFGEKRKQYIKENRENEKIATMHTLVKAKFKQNNELKNLLLDTWNSFLVEWNSRWDTFWGVNPKSRTGNNYLGKVLMSVREELQKE